MTGGMAGSPGASWVVKAPTGRSVGDHVCWPFRHRTELAGVVTAFVAEGLGRGERVAYVGQSRPRELREDLIGIPDLGDWVGRGQLQPIDAADLPASDPLSDPVDELIDLAAMTQDSLDAGYTGLRVVAYGTPRAVDPRRGTGWCAMSTCSTDSASTTPSPSCAPLTTPWAKRACRAGVRALADPM